MATATIGPSSLDRICDRLLVELKDRINQLETGAHPSEERERARREISLRLNFLMRLEQVMRHPSRRLHWHPDRPRADSQLAGRMTRSPPT